MRFYQGADRLWREVGRGLGEQTERVERLLGSQTGKVREVCGISGCRQGEERGWRAFIEQKGQGGRVGGFQRADKSRERLEGSQGADRFGREVGGLSGSRQGRERG